jgi:GGDEF domain-containing protein
MALSPEDPNMNAAQFLVADFMTIDPIVVAGDAPLEEAARLLRANAHPDNQPFGVVTVSVGAAEFGPLDLAENVEAWFARVDTALYAAKHAGRNQVAVAADPAGSVLAVAAATRTEVARRA